MVFPLCKRAGEYQSSLTETILPPLLYGSLDKKTARRSAPLPLPGLDYFQSGHFDSALVMNAWSPGIT